MEHVDGQAKLPVPDDRYTGFPPGRPARDSRCWMLDVAGAGRSSRRYPIAPDGHIPNSVIRQLFEPSKSKQLIDSTSKKPLRLRRRRAPIPTKSERTEGEPTTQTVNGEDEERASTYLNVTTRWDTWADEDDENVVSENDVQYESNSEGDSTERRKTFDKPAVSETPDAYTPSEETQPEATPSQELSATQPTATNEPSKRQRRVINAGQQSRLPPLPSQQQLRLLRQKREVEQSVPKTQPIHQSLPSLSPPPPPAPPPPEPKPSNPSSPLKSEPPRPKQPPLPPPLPPPSKVESPKRAPKKSTTKKQNQRQGFVKRAPPALPQPPQLPASHQNLPAEPTNQLDRGEAKESASMSLNDEAPPTPIPIVIVTVEDVDESADLADQRNDELAEEEPESVQGAPEATLFSTDLLRIEQEEIPEVQSEVLTELEAEPEVEPEVKLDVEEALEPGAKLEVGPEVESEQEPEAEQPYYVQSDSESNTEPDSQEEETEESRLELTLLMEIVSEPWFRQPDVPLLIEPVAWALTRLMSEPGISSHKHGEMCNRLLDIKWQLNFREDFEFKLVSELVTQLEALIDELMRMADETRRMRASRGDGGASVSSDSSVIRSKGDNLLELLRQMSHDLSDKLGKRWTRALLSLKLAEDANRQQLHNRRCRRGRRGLSDSGRGTESLDDSDETSSSGDSCGPKFQQRQLNPLSEEERQTVTTSLSQRDPDDDDKPFDIVDEANADVELLDEEQQLKESSTPVSMTPAVRFLLPTVVLMGSDSEDVETKHWLPPVPTPPPVAQSHKRQSNIIEAKEETIYDQMGDFRLKRMILNLPPIERIDLDTISERSRQPKFQCPRLHNEVYGSDRSSGFFSDRTDRPDTTTYFSTWRTAAESLSDDAHEQTAVITGKTTRLPPLSQSLTVSALAAMAGRRSLQRRSTAGVRFSSGVDDGSKAMPTRGPGFLMRPSDEWDGHCRMESLARHGMDAAGVRIGRHLARDGLLYSMLLPPLNERD